MLNPAAKSYKRVLIYRLGSLGDTVVALPALHLTAKAFPNAERRMLTSFPPNVKAPASSAILKNTGLVHEYFRYAYGTRSFLELLTLWWALFRWRPEILVYMSGPRGIASARRDSFFFRMCGIWRQVGVPLTEDMQRQRSNFGQGFSSPYIAGLPLEYECSRLVRNLSELGDISLEDTSSWDLHLTSAERTRADEVLASLGETPFIAACIGTKMQSKDWGEENWSTLTVEIAKRYPKHALVLCGAPEEADTSENVKTAWVKSSGAPALNLCGLLTPRQSAAVFAKATLFVGHDSGPMHLAASVGTPCVAVFSSRNLPSVWFPFGNKHRILYRNVECQNCNLETCITERKKCIMSITVPEVLSQIEDLLATRSVHNEQ